MLKRPRPEPVPVTACKTGTIEAQHLQEFGRRSQHENRDTNSPGCAKYEFAEKRIKKVVEKIAENLPHIQVSLVDITKNPEVVQQYMLFATPGIMINGELAFTGIPKEEELRRKIMEMSKAKGNFNKGEKRVH